MTDPDGGGCLATTRNLSAHDRREVRNFKRFLGEGVKPGPAAREVIPGWIPYMLGRFFYADPDADLSPPFDMGHVPITAWTFPG